MSVTVTTSDDSPTLQSLPDILSPDRLVLVRVPLPASHPMLARPGLDGSKTTPYSHYDNHDAAAPPKSRGRRSAPLLTVVAVLAALALFVACHEELRRALSVAEDDLRDGTISLESGSELKRSLRDITTRLSESDRNQLGALVDAAVDLGHHAGGSADATSVVGSAMDAGADFGFGGTHAAAADACGPACMDALANKLPGKTVEGGGGDGPVSSMGKYDVGDELKYRSLKKASDRQLKGAFVDSQVRKLDEAVKRGWSDLDKGKATDAREELKKAKEFHESELRLMRGSPTIAKYLGTPQEIRKLRDGIDEARGNIDRTPGRLAKIIDQPLLKKVQSNSGARSRNRGRGIPKKLEEIMDKQFTAADDNLKTHALSRISHHFRGGHSSGDSSSGWTSGGTAEVTLPRSTRRHRHESSLNGDFNKLALSAIERGRAAVNDGLYSDARKALSKAKMFLSSLKDAQERVRREARRGGDNREDSSNVRETAAVEKLQLEYSILAHAVKNLGMKRRRAEQSQLRQNLRVLHAPIQSESMTDYASRESDDTSRKARRTRTDRQFEKSRHDGGFEDTSHSANGARIRGDRVLFASSIRRGVNDADKGDIALSQAKLVEARYYAKRDGMLHADAETSDRQIRNGHVAKRALKLLARDIVKAEEHLQNSVRDEHGAGDKHRRFSLSSIMGLRSRRGGEAASSGGRREGSNSERAMESSQKEGRNNKWGGAMARALNSQWGVVDTSDVSSISSSSSPSVGGVMGSVDKAIDSALTSSGDNQHAPGSGGGRGSAGGGGTYRGA